MVHYMTYSADRILELKKEIDSLYEHTVFLNEELEIKAERMVLGHDGGDIRKLKEEIDDLSERIQTGTQRIVALNKEIQIIVKDQGIDKVRPRFLEDKELYYDTDDDSPRYRRMEGSACPYLVAL